MTHPPEKPADDLADVWGLLDALPPAAARVDLAATTVDLVAAKLAGESAPPLRRAVGTRVWATQIAVVAAALVAGLAAGRSVAPDPDQRVLQQLPIIEHLGILREAGSLGFLEAVAERVGGRQSPPRWMRLAREPGEMQQEATAFDIAVESLRRSFAEPPGPDLLARRRQHVALLPAAERAELERSVERFEALTSIDRRELTAVARMLADPAAGRLRDAARAWHLVVTAMNPVFRRTVVEMPVADRLEVLERSPGRFEPRPPGRPREELRDRRPPPGSLPEPGGFPPPADREGRPRLGDFPGPFDRQPPFQPPIRREEPPPGSDRSPGPRETPAPPR